MSSYKRNKKEILQSMVAALNIKPLGSITSTAELFDEINNGRYDLDSSEMMQLHNDLFKEAENHWLNLDMSSHEFLMEGLPYNLEFEIKPFKPIPDNNKEADYIDEQSLWNLFVVASSNGIKKDQANKIICQLIKLINSRE